MIDPIDIRTESTASFIESNTPPGATIAEVGCGSGHVAAELANRGYGVIGIDSDVEAIEQAREYGVDAILGSWPDVHIPCVDAIAFTRSLHHISPLSEAVTKVREVLTPPGTVLVEDFAFEEVGEAEVTWLLNVVNSRKGQQLISRASGAFVTKLVDADGAADSWREDHDHQLHTVSDMTEAIEESFVVRETLRVPYLYRYLVPVLPNSAEAADFIRETYSEELRLGTVGEIRLIGHRIVATSH